MPWEEVATLEGPPFSVDPKEITDSTVATISDKDDQVFINRDGALVQIPADLFRSAARQKWGQTGKFFQHAEDFEGWDGSSPAGTVDGTRLPGDFVWNYRISGTGANIQQTQISFFIPGTIGLNTGTTATGKAAVGAIFPQLAGFNIGTHREGGFTVKIDTLSAVGQTFDVLIGWSSSLTTNTPTNFVGFALPAGTANWQCRFVNAGVIADIDSGVVAETTAFHTFYQLTDEVNGVQRWYIDGVQVAASATGKPANNTLMTDGVFIGKLTGTTNRQIHVDKGYVFALSAATFATP